MNLKYYGSGIIPIIKDKNNQYFFVLFKSSIRKKGEDTYVEDSGGKFEGTNLKISAIRELKEESSLLFNLESFHNKNDIKNLYKVLKNFNTDTKGWEDDRYLSFFVYLKLKEGYFDLLELKSEFKSNMRKFWKNSFSVYTENKDIIFVPIKNIINLNETSEKIIDNNNEEHLLFIRTLKVFIKLKQEYNLENFIKKIIKSPISLTKKIIDEYDMGKKYKIKDLITHE